ncbi:dihydroxyacetone kinase subunit DhaK [Fictibacillus macauensis ZFHKF-1]|uniref:Dihydroxyacetone kinase subunit DhaK n=1 Tax=Fictibacillus macauensis ZFHKF-1 TaxID=1196324 RepID=I8J5A9_9BACL|nr:dihydroxyacetone kinase subunit DhaK [Fictibacillus macauensis]EIT86956.1 dihydroxyacetone kinase subunit DhaK [Fictibacillus macauensis ZFHKF-1]
MEKLMQQAKHYVRDMVLGIVSAHPDLYETRDGLPLILRKGGAIQGKVGLVSGGGSGHEPAHAGYVGDGMLDAAVCGEVFTSPTPDLILEGIKAAHGGAGVLLIVKNYAGDVMNFEMAKELAELEGIEVETVIVNDDIALPATSERRGVAGTVLVHKIAGAAAAAGQPLQEVKRVAEKVIANTRSIGMAVAPCYMPESGKPGFDLSPHEMEIGIGIHGEKGLERKSLAPVQEITAQLLQKLRQEMQGNDVIVLVNGMGGTPLSELYITYHYVAEALQKDGVSIKRSLTGNYMTALEMHGFSITLCQVDDELITYFDAPVHTVGFR